MLHIRMGGAGSFKIDRDFKLGHGSIPAIPGLPTSALFLAMAQIGRKVNFALSQYHFITNLSHLSENGLKNGPDFYRMLPKRKTVKKSHEIFTVFLIIACHP